MLNNFRKIKSSYLTDEDLVTIYNSISKNLTEEEKAIARSYIKRGHSVIRMLPFNKFIIYLKKLDSIQYRDDCVDLKEEILCLTQDKAQINTIERVYKKKPFRPSYKTLRQIRHSGQQFSGNYSMNAISKKCPHCGVKCTRENDSTYIICGYPDDGYDMKGCGRDWCFKCNKFLCKTWHIDHLYDVRNKFHDEKCCREHAKKMGINYDKYYCHCDNLFVDRSL